MFYRNYKDDFAKKTRDVKSTVWSGVTAVIIIAAIISYVTRGEIRDYNDSVGWESELQTELSIYRNQASETTLFQQVERELATGNLKEAEELLSELRDILDEK